MSEYIIVVNARTKLTKSLVDMALSLSKLSKHIRVFDEKTEDKALAILMKESLKTKRVSRDKVFKALE